MRKRTVRLVLALEMCAISADVAWLDVRAETTSDDAALGAEPANLRNVFLGLPRDALAETPIRLLLESKDRSSTDFNAADLACTNRWPNPACNFPTPAPVSLAASKPAPAHVCLACGPREVPGTVPEPGTLWLLGLALTLFILRASRRIEIRQWKAAATAGDSVVRRIPLVSPTFQ